jgi:hypothetical protein
MSEVKRIWRIYKSAEKKERGATMKFMPPPPPPYPSCREMPEFKNICRAFPLQKYIYEYTVLCFYKYEPNPWNVLYLNNK